MRIFLLLSLIVISLYAHKLNLFLEYENNNEQLYIYSYFASGTPCMNCEIKLMDENKKIIKKLQTNKEGEYYLKDFSGIKYVEVEALGGHAATLSIDEIIDEKMNKEEIKSEVKKEEKFSYFESIIALILVLAIFASLKKVKK